MDFLGVDIGCSAIKYGLVSLDEEVQVHLFDRIELPQTNQAENIKAALTSILSRPDSYTAAGFGFPYVVRGNKILYEGVECALNEVWHETQDLLKARNIPSFAINDADAAGMAEVYRPGAAEFRTGVTILLTLGTGIGSAIFLDGKLIPNTELGLIEMNGAAGEQYAAPSVKTREALTIQEWASRFQKYLEKIETLLAPDHLVLGGGISADFDEYKPLLRTQASLHAAYYRNQAGVVGTAIYAAQQIHPSHSVESG